MTEPTPAPAATPSIRLWDLTTNELLWPNAAGQAIEQYLAERTGWVGATADFPDTGTRWAGRMRIDPATGQIESRPEAEFLERVEVATNPLVDPATLPADHPLAGGTDD